MKKVLALLLVVLLVVGMFAGCRNTEEEAPVEPSPQPDVIDNGDDEPGEEGDWIIGVITGTVTQNEEEFQAGRQMQERFGADRVLHVTYPDRFNDEIETTITQVMSLVDNGAQAVIMCQAVPGTIASIQRLREQYPDVLFIAVTIQEPPREIAYWADVVLQADDIGMGTAIMEQAYAMGAEVFVHYSFPRHLAVEMIAQRRSLLVETAERLGIEFIDVMAPDPTGADGPAGAQQFIIEDVPRQVAEHGVNTAFFSTNCIMQEPLIRSVIEQGALYPQPCCPSPYHAFPGALNIAVPPGYEGNVAFMLEQITEAVAAAGMTGRLANWPVPVNMLGIEVGVLYAIEFLEGRTNGRMDPEAILATLNRVAAGFGVTVNVSNMEDEEGVIENMFLIISDSYEF